MTVLELDSTAGFRKMWQPRSPTARYVSEPSPNTRVVFLDRRAECKPDAVACWGFLPFRSRAFLRVYFDPPHNMRPRGSVHPRFRHFEELYGYLPPRRKSRKILRCAGEEFKRVLAAGGVVWVKTMSSNDHLKRDIVDRDFILECLQGFECTGEEQTTNKTWCNPKRATVFLTLKRSGIDESLKYWICSEEAEKGP